MYIYMHICICIYTYTCVSACCLSFGSFLWPLFRISKKVMMNHKAPNKNGQNRWKLESEVYLTSMKFQLLLSVVLKERIIYFVTTNVFLLEKNNTYGVKTCGVRLTVRSITFENLHHYKTLGSFHIKIK